MHDAPDKGRRDATARADQPHQRVHALTLHCRACTKEKWCGALQDRGLRFLGAAIGWTQKAERRQTPAPTIRSWVPREPQQSQVACGPTTTGRSQPSQKARNTLKTKSFNPWRMDALCADAALHLLEPLSRLPSLGGCPAHHADALQNASGCASVVRGTGTPNTKGQSKSGRGTAWWAKACVSPDQPSRCACLPLKGGQSWNSTDLALHVKQASVQRSEHQARDRKHLAWLPPGPPHKPCAPPRSEGPGEHGAHRVCRTPGAAAPWEGARRRQSRGRCVRALRRAPAPSRGAG